MLLNFEKLIFVCVVSIYISHFEATFVEQLSLDDGSIFALQHFKPETWPAAAVLLLNIASGQKGMKARVCRLHSQAGR